MTQERLQTLTELNNRIEHLGNVIAELQCTDGLTLYERTELDNCERARRLLREEVSALRQAEELK